MSIYLKQLLVLSLFWSTYATALWAQDPFFIHFFNNESFYNPAMVGYRGAMTINLKYKSQWGSKELSPFQSGIISLEESMPCSFFDYGLSFRFDQEGEGLFNTYDFGGRFAGTIPFLVGNSLHNLRAGASFQWTHKNIDFSGLVFSDELDPKYGQFDRFGFDLPTGFVPPEGAGARWFFTPSVGFAYKIISNENGTKPLTFTLGGSVHNAFSLGAEEFGDVESILGLEARIPPRYNAFLQTEIILFNNNYRFGAITPSIFYQNQEGLDYFELGSKFSLNQQLTIGAFYHHSPNALSGNPTDWMTFMLEWGGLFSNDEKRFDLGLAYSNNTTGLRNFVGPIFEISLSIHLRKSWGCSMMGRSDEVTYSKGAKCPTKSFSRNRKKIYENIWYQ